MDLFDRFHSLSFLSSFSDQPVIFLSLIFIASLLGSTHCVSMCGPVAFLAQKQRFGLYQYQLGRLLSYLILGSFLGYFGFVVFEKYLYHPVFSGVLSLFIILSLCVLIFRLLDRSIPGLVFLQNFFIKWNTSLFGKFFRIFSGLKKVPFVLGLLTSLLPCGWLGFFYLISFSQKDSLLGALTLVVFWAGSLPVFILLSQFSQNIFMKYGVKSKKVAALILSIVVVSLSVRLILPHL